MTDKKEPEELDDIDLDQTGGQSITGLKPTLILDGPGYIRATDDRVRKTDLRPPLSGLRKFEK